MGSSLVAVYDVDHRVIDDPPQQSEPIRTGFLERCSSIRFLRLSSDEIVKLLRRFLGAIALGVGAVFGHKAERKTHWSEPPNWTADNESEDRDSGDP